MRVLLVVSAFNGLSQRVWDELRARGHHVTVSAHDDPADPADPCEFGDWLDEVADRYTDPAAWRGIIYSRISVDRPLDYYESLELAEMARDLYDDRH